MTEDRRLIEVAFPLKEASLDSVHEKNVRHGHISTLHIWPARRPLAASRAALIATLLPDPGDDKKRKVILDKLGGSTREHIKKKKLPDGTIEQQISEETEGGILHWGRENSADLDWFRARIKDAYGGRAPRVLDPFAGGGAIPLEAMRLGCEVTAVDINPVAWFILKCTLEYPQRLANQKRPLPDFVLRSREFMEQYYKGHGLKDTVIAALLKAQGLAEQEPAGKITQLGLTDIPDQNISTEADLAWHVRAWGWWVLQQARAELERFYPTVDGQPTVAYLWARTVICKNCRATVPLLKTRWLCKKDKKRVALTMQPNAERTGVVFGIDQDVPLPTGTAAQKREAEQQNGGGTMSGSGAKCPCCRTIMTRGDLQQAGWKGQFGSIITAIIVDGKNGKEYRLPTVEEIVLASEAEKQASKVFEEIPFGMPDEPIPRGASRSGGGSSFTVFSYGMTKWSSLFTSRQLLGLGTFIKYTRIVRDLMRTQGYSKEWVEAVSAYLALSIDRIADRGSTICTWTVGWDKIRNTFTRFALSMTWDFAESVVSADSSGGYPGAIEWVTLYLEHAMLASKEAPPPTIIQSSAIKPAKSLYDAIVTDPPYYDAIQYSDLMDFFYVWLRRSLYGLSPEIDDAFAQPLSPKWDHAANDGELIDDASRFDGDKEKSKKNYEDGMARVFQACYKSLAPDGRLIVVFAHKHPDAWETLVSAIIRAGFVVDASWPIQTEMGNRTRALSSAALASSVWLVCKKRPETARPGWDNAVLEEMRSNIIAQLNHFWDDGIRGPDFVWAATGPALEAYSRHPVVKKTQAAGKLMSVGEFLRHVRRMVVDYVVGRVLSHNGGTDVSGLDDVTTYYLLHRHNFGLVSVPSGPCILYAVSCGLSDAELVSRYDLLARTGGQAAEANDDESEDESEGGSGSSLRLKQWYQRKSPNLGLVTASTPIPPLIDQVHRLMHLWESGEVGKVNEYLDARGLGANALFNQLLQALIELAPAHSEERSRLESISNHIQGRNAIPAERLF
jgi:putative DNA methylase